jgi:hypothetical protein
MSKLNPPKAVVVYRTPAQESRFAEGVSAFLAVATEKRAAYFAKNFPELTPEPLEVQDNLKYIRIVSAGSQRSVFCFIDKRTGDILKADGWKRPAKHARGNIFTPDHGDRAITPWGAQYLDNAGRKRR